ncbi:MAG: DUF167 family protein [Pseudomonadota bacterium]
MSAPWYRWDGDDLILHLHIQPRAAKTEVAGPYGDRLKVRITAPPVDGKANTAVIALLSELCGVAKSNISLLAGATGREKSLRIHAPRRWPAGITPPLSR